MASPHTILFVASCPEQCSDVQSNEEYRAIARSIDDARLDEQVQLQHMPATRRCDLLKVPGKRPAILHYSGHGAGDKGLCFQSDDRSIEYVTISQIECVVRASRRSLRVALLNACYTEAQARILLKHVPCVIANIGAIGDRDAIVYSEMFYRALVNGESVGCAHEQGELALALQSTSGSWRDVVQPETGNDARCPTLLTRDGEDAGCIFLIDDATRRIAEPAPRRRATRSLPLALAWVAAAAIFVLYQVEDHGQLASNVRYHQNDQAIRGDLESSSQPDAIQDGRTPGTSSADARPNDRTSADTTTQTTPADPGPTANAEPKDTGTASRTSAEARQPSAPPPKQGPPARDSDRPSGQAQPVRAGPDPGSSPSPGDKSSDDSDQIQDKLANGGLS